MALSTGLIAGLLQPLSKPAHALALIGLGLVAGRKFFPAGGAITGAFGLGLAAGLGAIAWGIGETPAGDVLLVGALLCGLIAAFDVTLRVSLTAPVALMSGIGLGLDSPPQSIALDEAVAMLVGTACGGIAALAMIGFAASMIARWRRGIARRVAGSWVAAIAILVLALRWVA